MAQFLTDLECTPLDDGVNWRLTKALKFCGDDGVVIRVPVGFTTDFASIPNLARIGLYIQLVSVILSLASSWFWIGFVIGSWLVWVDTLLCHDSQLDAPATVHDYLYRVDRRSKLLADVTLFEAMGCTRRPGWERWTVFLAVLFFGWKAWKGDAMRDSTGSGQTPITGL